MDIDLVPGQRLTSARLHDGTNIQVLAVGRGPHLLLPARMQPHDVDTATAMRQWGADPDVGPTLIRGLADICTVVVADCEGHRLAHSAPRTLTRDNITTDLLAIADAAGASTFACYGYSWLALAAFQLALRTNRLTCLVMGGFPPIDGPYAAMLAVTRAAHAMAVAETISSHPDGADIPPGDWGAVRVQTDAEQTQQFLTLCETLQDVDDATASRRLDIPRFCFTGELDNIDYGPGWGDIRVAIADAIGRHREDWRGRGGQSRPSPT
jgi:pimeloyl-ACP methyl ester carboxylesterase